MPVDIPSDPHASKVQSKLITCMLPDDGRAQELIIALKVDKGVITANMFHCRGIGVMDKPGRFGRVPAPRSVQVVTIVVPDQRAEEIFEYVYEQVDIDRPNGGFMYQMPLMSATPFFLPEGIEEETL
jgi:hypothetical protein